MNPDRRFSSGELLRFQMAVPQTHARCPTIVIVMRAKCQGSAPIVSYAGGSPRNAITRCRAVS